MALGSRIDDIIKAGRQAAKQSQKVVSHRTTQAAVNNLDETIKAAKNVVNNMGNGTTQTVVRNFDEQVKNAKKVVNNMGNGNTQTVVRNFDEQVNAAKNVVNNNTTVPSRYDGRGNYQQALEKAKEVANTNTTTKAINNNTRNAQNTINNTVNNTQQRIVPPIQNPWEPSWNEWTEIGNMKNWSSPILEDEANVKRIMEQYEGPKATVGPTVENAKNINNTNNSGPKPPEPPELNLDNKDLGIDQQTINKTIEQQKQGFNLGEFGNKYFGGITDTYNGTRAGDGFWNSLQSAHKNTDGTYRWDRIAGTYAAAALGARVVSGGGIYKDRYGNSNLPGIPFI